MKTKFKKMDSNKNTKMYCTIIRDIQEQVEFVHKYFYSPENCLLSLEEYIQEFIYSKQGHEKEILYVKTPPTLGVMKYGFFVIKSGFLRYEIYERQREVGLFYNSHNDNKIFTISFGKNTKCRRKIKIVENKLFEQKWKQCFDDCLEEIPTTKFESEESESDEKEIEHGLSQEEEVEEEVEDELKSPNSVKRGNLKF